ncbi:MAG: hypothetical protein WBI20_14835 [Burkholderiaceae bacterium]
MSFQTIIDIHQSITVNNRRMVGQQVSRSGQVTTAQYLTAVPWVFTVVPHDYLYYPKVRDVIQTIDNLDRQLTGSINFSAANLSWFAAMRGTATTATLNGAPAANTQILNLTSNGTFKAGDFIQIAGYVYKVTADSAGSSVGIHRPLIGTPASGSNLTLGSNVSFTVLAESCPTYTLTPMVDGAFVNWDGPFVFREFIA